MRYTGICQCGTTVFELRAELLSATPPPPAQSVGLPGARLWSVPRESLRLLGAEEGVGAYTFSERIIGHRFCRTCGTHLYGEELDGSGPSNAYLNVDCLALEGRVEPEAEPA